MILIAAPICCMLLPGMFSMDAFKRFGGHDIRDKMTGGLFHLNTILLSTLTCNMILSEVNPLSHFITQPFTGVYLLIGWYYHMRYWMVMDTTDADTIHYGFICDVLVLLLMFTLQVKFGHPKSPTTEKEWVPLGVVLFTFLTFFTRLEYFDLYLMKQDTLKQIQTKNQHVC